MCEFGGGAFYLCPYLALTLEGLLNCTVNFYFEQEQVVSKT